MAGPWSYDLELITLTQIDGAVAQTISLSQTVSGDSPIRVGAVAQTIDTAQATDGVSIAGPWSFDLDLLAATVDGTVAQSISLTQAVDCWETVDTVADGTYTYEDTTFTPGRTNYYRVTDNDGNVIYSEGVEGMLYREDSVAQSIALSQTTDGTQCVLGRVSHSIALSQTTDGEVYSATTQEGAVAQAVTTTQAVGGFRTPEYGAALQSVALAQSVDGVTAQGLPVAYGAVADAVALSVAVDGSGYTPTSETYVALSGSVAVASGLSGSASVSAPLSGVMTTND